MPHSAIRIPQSAFPPLLLLSPEPMVCAVMNQFWLVKQEPTAYSWDQFVADGKTDGPESVIFKRVTICAI